MGMKLEHSETINAAVERVWALTIDVESWPTITPTTVTSVQPLDGGPLRVGSTARIKQPGQRAKVWTVTAIEPTTCFAWQARVFGTTMTATHTLASPQPHTTTNSLRIDLEGPLARMVAFVAGRQMRRVLATENRCFREAAESASSAPHPHVERPRQTGA
jgi:uncharacterized membrane protein